jgi:phosphate transport system substrate-binding protein
VKFFKSALVSSVLVAASFGVAAKTTINGAGATFPLPIYAKWAEQYQKETGVQINYQGIGSGGGIRQITAKTVDFGASDAPLTVKQLDQKGMIQFPMVMGAIVPVVNIPGIHAGEMKLTGNLVADIYLGKIKKWNDPAIVALNRNLTLPDQAIYVVHRSDGSGTTFNFTQYLNQVSYDWRTKVGYAKAIDWPKAATGIGGKGNAGVANFVNRTKGAIGYVEYAYAKQNNLAYTQMRSRDGKFLMPTMKTFQAAAANADWKNAPGYHLLLNNQPGDDSWPLTAATFILLHKNQDSTAKAEAMVKFFTWSYNHGKYAEALDYVPMPEKVVSMVNNTWKQSLKHDGHAIIQ